MIALPDCDELLAVARRIVWFEPPAEALRDAVRFLAYAAARATHADMRVIRAHVSDDDFREALDHAPPGIIDARSWAYWHSKLGRWPPPPMPARFGREAGSPEGVAPPEPGTVARCPVPNSRTAAPRSPLEQALVGANVHRQHLQHEGRSGCRW